MYTKIVAAMKNTDMSIPKRENNSKNKKNYE